MNKTRKRRGERLLPGVMSGLDRLAQRVETGLQSLRQPGPVLPADVGKRLLEAMLAPEHILEDARYFKIVPNDYLIELNTANYQRHYQPVEKTLYRQWRDKLLEALNTANSRQGRREYRFGGRVRLHLQPVADLSEKEIRLHCQINPAVDTPAVATTCLELWTGGRRWSLREDVTVLGRDALCEVWLDLPDVQQKRLVSGRHAYICREDGQFRLYDGSPEGKASVNGTFVNGRPVARGGHPLQEGDLIILASLDPRQSSLDTPGVAGLVFRAECG